MPAKKAEKRLSGVTCTFDSYFNHLTIEAL